ncbi:hypothetical protein [Francisella sp. SYW-9]|uniref:hypothetical protein n=1 Tax=Francisella sp. SYW-9 TaxID=2610888 RepID=UPI00168D9184|nr:hypothetical protein [Francisella sp. SYW-9]
MIISPDYTYNPRNNYDVIISRLKPLFSFPDPSSKPYMSFFRNIKSNHINLINISVHIEDQQGIPYDCLNTLHNSYALNESYPSIPLELAFYKKSKDIQNDYKIVFCKTITEAVLRQNTHILFIVKNLPLVDEYPENVINDGPIDSIDRLLEKITRHLIKVKLQDVITKSVREYINWFDNRKSIGFINRHGVDGKDRALALERMAYRAKSLQEVVNAITSFFNNTITDEHGKKIPGNIRTRNHSFISFFLNQLKYEHTFIKKELLPTLTLNSQHDYTSSSMTNERETAKRLLSLRRLS